MRTPDFDFNILTAPSLMGVVNITPDSFSDGGAHFDPVAAIARARALAAAGAQLLDLGAEASSFFRPGVVPTAPAEQRRRLLPVLEGLHDLRSQGVALSVDTRSAEVAQAAIDTGAAIINDISAGEHDPQMLPVVAQRGAAIILMHISPIYPENPATDDPDIVATVGKYLSRRVATALAAGIPRQRIAIDPGLGFGKTMADNWRLLLASRQLGERAAGFPVVSGASRKRFLETPPPADVAAEWRALLPALTEHSEHPRDPASAAAALLAARHGAAIHRVHNVTLARRALTMGPA